MTEAYEKCMEWYNEGVTQTPDDIARTRNIYVADEVFKMFSSMGSLIGLFYETVTKTLKVEKLNISALKCVKGCLEKKNTSYDIGLLLASTMGVKKSKKGKTECIKRMFKNLDVLFITLTTLSVKRCCRVPSNRNKWGRC